VSAPALVVRSLLCSAVLAAVALLPVQPASARGNAVAPKGPVLLIGDSVVAWSTKAFARQPGLRGVTVDAVACRGAVFSCATPTDPIRPPTGLVTLQAWRGHLTTATVVIELGYNDRPQGRAIDRVMRELRNQGVRRVAWVNLSDRRPEMASTNAALEAARARWPELVVWDWRTFSTGHDDWFLDGVHLTPVGKTAFAGFLAQALRHVT
jgi:hypothetical protein